MKQASQKNRSVDEFLQEFINCVRQRNVNLDQLEQLNSEFKDLIFNSQARF